MIQLEKLSLHNYLLLASLVRGERSGSEVRADLLWKASHEAFTSFVGRLVKGGLVSCRYAKTTPTSGRRAFYTLTTEGQKAYDDFKEMVQIL